MSVTGITETTQYLTFKLDEEIFALDISKVKEVLDFTEITKIPQTPEFMKGVINLRGGVVPVVDMRLKFGMSETAKTVNTCIIIVEVTHRGGDDGARGPGRFGSGGDGPRAGADRARAEDRDAAQDGVHPGNGEAGQPLHHDPGHRQGVLGG